MNHKVISLSFINGVDGISTPNYPPLNGEITHNYNTISSINRFFYQGFFCRETIIFSFPFSINFNNLGINLICEGKELNDDSMIIDRSDNKITIKGLPIADLNNSKLPSDYFDEMISRIADVNIPKDILFKIIELNISARQNILKESSLVNNEVSNMFSEIIHYEINLISSYD